MESAVQTMYWSMPCVGVRARVSTRYMRAGGKEGAYVRVLGPDGEVGGVEGVLLLEALDDGLVLEEEDGAVAGGEAAVDLALGRAPLVGGDDGLERVEDDLPELLVLVSEEEDGL